jgi:hypothetical protein
MKTSNGNTRVLGFSSAQELVIVTKNSLELNLLGTNNLIHTYVKYKRKRQ